MSRSKPGISSLKGIPDGSYDRGVDMPGRGLIKVQ
jgi:hypothetical protein